MTSCGVVNRYSFGVKIITAALGWFMGMNAVVDVKALRCRQGEQKGKNVHLGFLFWKITRIMRCGRTQKVFFLLSLNFRNDSPWAHQNHPYRLR